MNLSDNLTALHNKPEFEYWLKNDGSGNYTAWASTSEINSTITTSSLRANKFFVIGSALYRCAGDGTTYTSLSGGGGGGSTPPLADVLGMSNDAAGLDIQNVGAMTAATVEVSSELKLTTETASRLAIVDATNFVKSANTATYPSLTELAYVKGVTSAVQAQLDGKQASLGYTAENTANKATNLTSPDNTKFPTTQAVSTALSLKQDSLGYTAENEANKETTALDTSTTKYPCNNVVKTAVDAKQNADDTLTALAGLSTTADKIITVTGTDTFGTDDWHSQAKATYSGTITWIGTTAPSGTTNHQYRWMRTGHLVTLSILLHYASNGSALNQVAMDLPSGSPAVDEWSVLSAASELQYAGVGYVAGSTTTFPSAMARVFLRRDSGDTKYEVVAAVGSGNYGKAWVTVQYFTS